MPSLTTTSLLFTGRPWGSAPTFYYIGGTNCLLLLAGTSYAHPDGILNAYLQYFNNTPALVGAFKTVYFGDSPPGTCEPNLVVRGLTNVPYWHTGTDYYETQAITFSIWHSDGDLARQYGNLVQRYTDRFLNFQMVEGYLSTFVRRRSGLVPSMQKGPETEPMYQYFIDYTAYVSKQLTPF